MVKFAKMLNCYYKTVVHYLLLGSLNCYESLRNKKIRAAAVFKLWIRNFLML